jgi:hypothetical protein
VAAHRLSAAGRLSIHRRDAEARLDSLLRPADDQQFTEAGTIEFGHGHALRLSGRGELIQTASPELRQGVAVWVVEGRDGQFADANGRITSNFLLSQKGELTDCQLGVVFARRACFTTTRRAPEHQEPRGTVRLTE